MTEEFYLSELTGEGQRSYAGGMVGQGSPEGAQGAPQYTSPDRTQEKFQRISQKATESVRELGELMGVPLSIAREDTGEGEQESNKDYLENLQEEIANERDGNKKRAMEREAELRKILSDEELKALREAAENESDSRKQMEMRARVKYEEGKRAHASEKKKKGATDIREEKAVLQKYDVGKVKAIQARMDAIDAKMRGLSQKGEQLPTSDIEERKRLGEELLEINAPVLSAVRQIEGDAWFIKHRLSQMKDGKEHIVDPQLLENWDDIKERLDGIDEAQRSGNLEAARTLALELADMIKPFFTPEIQRGRGYDNADMYWVPRSAEDLWRKIAEHQSEEFAPGGEYALINIDRGEVGSDGKQREKVTINQANITEWLRREITRVHKFNSTSESKIFEMISIRAGFTNFQIFELLWQKNYWLHETITADGTTEKFYQPYDNLREQLFMETWKYMLSHDHAVTYRNAMGSEDETVKALSGFYSRPNYFTATRGRLRDSYCYGSTDVHHDKDGISEIERKLTGTQEAEAFQGTLGKAGQRMQLAYDYIAESVMVEGSSQYGRIFDEETNEKYENLFEKALGERGSKAFYRDIIHQIISTEYNGTFSVAEALVNELNKGRKEWERVDLLDLLFEGEASFQSQLSRLGISPEQYATIKEKARKKLERKGVAGEEWNRQLQVLSQGREAVLLEMAKVNGGKGKFGITSEDGKFNGKFAQWMQAFSRGKIDERAFAVELARQVWIADDENILNVFSHPQKGQVTEKVRHAMVQAMVKELELRSAEVDYMEGMVFDLAYLFGSAAKNDVDGIGFNAWSKWMNAGRYRDGQTDFKNAFGNPVTIRALRRLSFSFFEGVRVRKEGDSEFTHSLKYILQGGEGSTMNLDAPLPVFDFRENASNQFFADHISFVSTFFKNLNKIEVEFGKLLSHDPRTGSSVKNFEAFQQFIDSYWKPIRYFKTNANPPGDEKFRSWQYSPKLQIGGKIKRTATITTKTLDELSYGKEVREMGMPDMANNIFTYLVSSQIALHLPPLCHMLGYKEYGVSEVEELRDLFVKTSRTMLLGGNTDITLITPAITEEQWDKLLETAKTSWWKLYMTTYGWDAAGTVKDFFLGFFGQFMKAIAPMGK